MSFKSKRVRAGGLLAVLSAGFAALWLVACSTTPGTIDAAPQIEGAFYVGNKVCADCHGGLTRMFPAGPHARIHLDAPKLAGQTGCESCHGPGSKHVEAGGGVGKFIINPRKDVNACFQCHLRTQGELQLPQHHLVIEGRMGCVDCHDPHGADIFKRHGGLAMARVNETCSACHREQTRPFVFEHEAMREGCVVCHNPHGSINRKLLVQSDPNLCLKCHAQVQLGGSGEIFIGNARHTLFLRQGTCWSAGCHTAVHGSNVHPRMFY